MLEEALEQGNEMFRAIKLEDLFCSQDGKSCACGPDKAGSKFQFLHLLVLSQ